MLNSEHLEDKKDLIANRLCIVLALKGSQQPIAPVPLRGTLSSQRAKLGFRAPRAGRHISRGSLRYE